jgi:addiction module HigA family antidote
MPPSTPIIPIDAHPFGTHPGVYLRQWLSRRRLSETAAAAMLEMSRHNINMIVNLHRGVTAATALALDDLLGTPDGYWTTLQKNFEKHRATVRRQRKRKP